MNCLVNKRETYFEVLNVKNIKLIKKKSQTYNLHIDVK